MTEAPKKDRKEKRGIVVSNKMDKTIVVASERGYAHPVFGKTVKVTKRFYAEDAENQCQIGDQVSIVECRPLSKLKRWKLKEILKKNS